MSRTKSRLSLASQFILGGLCANIDRGYHTLAALTPPMQLRQACRIAHLEVMRGNLKYSDTPGALGSRVLQAGDSRWLTAWTGLTVIADGTASIADKKQQQVPMTTRQEEQSHDRSHVTALFA